MNNQAKSIKIVADDKYFENKEVKEQLKKMKKIISKIDMNLKIKKFN